MSAAFRTPQEREFFRAKRALRCHGLVVSLSLTSLIVALALVFFGQRLYWLFVGGIGFIVGMNCSAVWLEGQAGWVIFLCALLTGIVGALIAILFQRIAVGVAAFLAGGYFALLLLTSTLPTASEISHVVASLVAGAIAGMLAVALLDWVLIVLSALLGAAIIADWAAQDRILQLSLFLVLLVTGVAFQALMRSRRLSSSQA